MFNLFTKQWTDQKNNTSYLRELDQNHLENIEKMLADIIDGKRPQPEGSNQSKWELKASLIYVQRELEKRAKTEFIPLPTSLFTQNWNFPPMMGGSLAPQKGITTKTVVTVTFGPLDSVANLVATLKTIDQNLILSGTKTLIFESK